MRTPRLVAYFFFLAIAGEAAAQEFQGLDILALAKQDLTLVEELLPERTSIGVLDGTFGPTVPALESLLRTGRVPLFRAHLLNGPCRRNKNCEKSEPKLRDLRALRRRALSFGRLSKRHPGVLCLLSPVLEYDERRARVVQSWIRTLERAAPSCTPVLSVFTGRTLPGYLVERHHLGARADVVSNDGVGLEHLAKYRATLLTMAWQPSFNLRVANAPFVSPSKRRVKATRVEILEALEALKKAP